MITGDFNTPDVKWVRDSDRPRVASPHCVRMSPRASLLLEWLDRAGVAQHVVQPTRASNFLDLVLSKNSIVRCSVRTGIFDSDHAEICSTVQGVTCKQSLVNRKSALNYKRADFDGMRRSLQLIAWDAILDAEINEAVDVFYDVLESAIRDHIPTVTLRRTCPPWFDADVRRALRDKKAAFRRMKRNRASESVDDFENKRRIFKKLSSDNYFEHVKGLVGDFKSNPKRYWTFLKCIKGSKSQLSVLKDGDREISDDIRRTNLLNQTFGKKKINEPKVTKYPETAVYDLPTLEKFHVSIDQIRVVLGDLNVHKACDP